MRKRNQVGKTLGADMSDELANFYDDDAYGKKRENEFVGRNNRWRQHAAKAKFPAFDLFIDVTPDKKLKLELKSERRSTKETPNFFVELISNDKTQEPGGPFKPGLEATYYVHWFSDGGIFCFFTTDFRKSVEDFLATDEGKRATRHRKYNRGYTTIGVCAGFPKSVPGDFLIVYQPRRTGPAVSERQFPLVHFASQCGFVL